MIGIIDTHCHLQSARLVPDLDELVASARKAGVETNVICAGSAADWSRCIEIAHRFDCVYMLGIHPLATPEMKENDLALLEARVKDALTDPRFIGIGEIGIDGLVPLDDEKQEYAFVEQLKIARRHLLPVSVHVRKSASRLIKYFRRIPPVSGVVHAFNGSEQERDFFLKMGLKLGFGGAATYDGSRRIRRHLAGISTDAWVLETDAPDMPSSQRRDAGSDRTEPADIVETAKIAAELRGETLEAVISSTRRNAIEAFPRLRKTRI